MNFTRAAVLGFSTGFVTAVIVSRIRVPRPRFLIFADQKEHLSIKEAAAKINDALEDRDILFELFSRDPQISPEMFNLMKIKALTEPRWADLLERFSS